MSTTDTTVSMALYTDCVSAGFHVVVSGAHTKWQGTKRIGLEGGSGASRGRHRLGCES